MTDFSVYFNKYVNVRDTVHVDKDFDVSAYQAGRERFQARRSVWFNRSVMPTKLLASRVLAA